MATITIVLKDVDGLVDVETTVHEGWTNSPAVQLAGRISEFLGGVAKQQGETENRSAPAAVEAAQH